MSDGLLPNLQTVVQSGAGIDGDGQPLPRAEDDPWLKLVGDGADIMAKQLPPVVQVVSGLVCAESKLLVCSSAKAWKTWLLMHLVLCVSRNLEFWGRATVRCRVLYVNLELKASTFERRVQILAEALGITIDRTWFAHLPLRGKLAGCTVHQIVDRIIRIAQHLGITVVAIDPLYKLNIEGEENSSRDQTRLFNELDRITTDAHCTLLLNDHSGKGNQSEKQDPLDVIRGSSAKGGDIDVGMVLRKHEVENCFRVDMIHRELPPVNPFVVEMIHPCFQLRPDLDPAKMLKPKGGRPTAYDSVALLTAIVKTTPKKAVSISAWAATVGIKRQTLTGYLPRLRAKDWIATAGEGNTARQYITKKGREFLRQAKEGA
jgi:predicted transcriptional regulator